MDNQNFPKPEEQNEIPIQNDILYREAFLKEAQKKEFRKSLSRIGWAVFAMLILWSVLVTVLFLVSYGLENIGILDVGITDSIQFLYNELGLAISMLVCVLIVRPMKARVPEKNKVPFSKIFELFCIFYMMGTVGNIIGNFITITWGSIIGHNPTPPLDSVIEAANPVLMVITLVVTGPILEEIIFRKLLIDRLNRFGAMESVLISAAFFALFHGNFNQLFYTFGGGLILGYLYIKSGKVWMTMLVHGCFNSIATVMSLIAPKMDRFLETASEILNDASITEPGVWEPLKNAFVKDGWTLIPFGLITLFAMICTVLGLIYFFKNLSKIRLSSNMILRPGEKMKALCLNSGMIAVIIVSALTLLQSLFL